MALSITLNAILTSSQPIPHLFIHPSNRPSITDCYHSFPKTKILISDYAHCYSWQIFMARTSPHTCCRRAGAWSVWKGFDLFTEAERRGALPPYQREERAWSFRNVINLLTQGEERERTGKRAKGFHANISLSCSLSVCVSLPIWLCVMSHLLLAECRPSNKTGWASVRGEMCKSCPSMRGDRIQFSFILTPPNTHANNSQKYTSQHQTPVYV